MVMLPDRSVVMLPVRKVVMLPLERVVILPLRLERSVVMLPAKAVDEIVAIRMVTANRADIRLIVFLLVN